MKFGREFQTALVAEGFPPEWTKSAIDYKNLKKCIKKVHRELVSLGLDAGTIGHLSGWMDPLPPSDAPGPQSDESASTAEPGLSTITEEFTPQLRMLVDANTGEPLDATLAPETRVNLQELAKHEIATANRHAQLGHATQPVNDTASLEQRGDEPSDWPVGASGPSGAKWIQIPLASAKDFFDLLEPKLLELEALNEAEEKKLEEEILDVGDAVENVTEPVREGAEALRSVSYRDLYFWREMFRLYMERPVFYAQTERNRGALSFKEAKSRLEAYDQQLRATGLLAKLKTPQARLAAKQFHDVNVDILRIMHFQEMNARAMRKILKKFDKQTHLEGKAYLHDLRRRHPALLKDGKNASGGFANSIARDLYAEISSKVLAIVPQLDDWTCPVCLAMAWRPVSLGCCKSVFCIRCIIKLQDEGMKRCPCCNKETVMQADGRNIDFETTEFLQKYFPLEVKARQKENETANLVRQYGEHFVKPSCLLM